MIKSIKLVNFKNFVDETLRVGSFTVIVGTNASGKSNVRDAFRFLHGIGRGYTLAEIFGGKYGPGGQLEWSGIRGAPYAIVRFGQPAFSIQLDLEYEGNQVTYFIKIEFPANSEPYVSQETLTKESKSIYKARANPGFGLQLYSGTNDRESGILDWSKPALTQIVLGSVDQESGRSSWSTPTLTRIAGDYIELYKEVIFTGIPLYLYGFRFIEPEPASMRVPSVPGTTILGETGHNLSTVLEAVCADANRKRILTEWVHELTPMDVTDFEFPRDPSGLVHLLLHESNGNKVSAYSASDGTLRFLALLGALLTKDQAGLYFLEEIDNGIHPSRLSLLVELIEKQTSKGGIQVVTTTHSPDFLGLVNDSTFENTSVIFRDESAASGVIRPVSKLPKARNLRQTQGLGRLLASGWMEDALAFSEFDTKGEKEEENDE